jgi:hypothetical protein
MVDSEPGFLANDSTKGKRDQQQGHDIGRFLVITNSRGIYLNNADKEEALSSLGLDPAIPKLLARLTGAVSRADQAGAYPHCSSSQAFLGFRKTLT